MLDPIALADADTRERLVTVASELFAENGFRKVTVRDICTAAAANVAAVNYHFGDKLGLYRQVLERAIAAQQSLTEAARAAGEGRSAEERLHEFIRVFVSGAQHRPTWVRGLLFREMSDPTPALDELVDRGVRPRLDYLASIVIELLGCGPDDPRVMPCAGSVMSQLIIAMPSPIGDRLRQGRPTTEDDTAALIEHFTAFSLAGIAKIRTL